ncbi:hypothetical protein RHOSPDRAFT_36757 [Rhodotorula sp. JG-1b]|nr:hypothetical protein RHOSPDRAFT_36757 [Rhodotorula sp. JG-1b]
MAEEAAAAADPLSLQRHSAASGAGAASSSDMDAIRSQPALADRLQSLQLDNENQPDRTQPHPLPVAGTSSSSSPRLSLVVEPDLAAAQPGENPQPTKRKLVLLKRPATPTNRTTEASDRRSDDPTTSSDPIDCDYSSHSQENSGSATTPAAPYGIASPGDLAEADPAAAAAAAPALDPVLYGALNHPRDRFLLLRAEVELERFILNQAMTRLPLAPPHFQPGLNSYQRLLIHRLADMFGITREVEPAPPTMWNAGMINPATGQPQGVVVLVKSEIASTPSKKLASYVPAPDSTPSVASPAPHLSVARTSSSVVSSPAASPDNSSPAASVSAAAAPPPQPVFKILPRASRGTSSASSSADVDDDGSSSFSTSTRSKLRRDLTLEEREAAYKEARERIFNRPDPVEQRTTPPAAPPSTSAASSNAGEDAASIQSSLGYGITRPSSAGSTFSRSSAALSLSGQRPPPSIASDSNSSMRSGYFGYYHQQQQQPGPVPPPPPPAPPAGSGGIPYPMPNLRQAAPSFDPATGGWTYHPTTPMINEFAQTPSSYSMMSPHYGGMQSPPAPPMMMPSYQQPAPTLQFDPSSGAAMTPSASWHRNLPSPALSGSSGNSYPPSQQQQQQQPPSGPSSTSASANPDAGYLMRFPEGAIVTAGGGVVGPPQPYAAVAVEAGLRSASTLSLGGSSSASRVATRGGTSSGPNSLRRLSQSTTQSLGSGSVHSSSAPMSDDAASSSRRSPSATSGAADDSPEASLAGENLSEVGSSAGGGSGSGPSSLAGGGGSSDGKRHGRKATIIGRRGRPDRPREAEDGEESSREPSPLHPSLPAKPSWAAAAAASSAQTSPSRTSAGSSSSPPVKSGDQVGSLTAAPSSLASARGGSSLASSPRSNGGAPGFPPLSRPVGGGGSIPPPPPPPPPVQGAWTRPSGAYVGSPAGPPPSAPNGFTQYASAPTQAPAPHLLQHPHPHQQQQHLQQQPQQQQQQHHLQPSSYSAWLSQAAVGPPPVQVSYQPGPGGARHPTQARPAFYAPSQPPPAGQPADLMTMPDMRRPPPRSTQLFDPNKPTNPGEMRRVASGAGSARRM